MNEIEKAIKITKENIEILKEQDEIGAKEQCDIEKIILYALEKQIAKKPTGRSDDCPNCENVRILHNEKYCVECGQALDWSGDI